ncbi:hypothetical protein BGZ60DRAFT_402478 [Tricladium varicosporioides]|nr:hypothetical protein BGZ60DRAFT_402478 [Hymenoscyphus varicosporioides]
MSEPTHIIMMADDISSEKRDAVKKDIESQGGKVTKDYGTFMPCLEVVFSPDHVSTFKKHPDIVSIENNGTVKTQ